ncbi:MAG: DUF5916 domain-containing protein [Bacteroidota bacterium]|nr:DUF5916 domain-containing protein [Bacteroidota bacterium]
MNSNSIYKIKKIGKIVSSILFVLFLGFSSSVIIASEPIQIPKIDGIIEFDGLPFEEAWEKIKSFPVVGYIPDFGAEPSEKTEIRMCYNDQYLYISGRLYDNNPSRIRNTSKQRDDFGGNSDALGIILDSFNDKENGLVFSTTPSGQRTDYSVYNDANAFGGSLPFNISWNTFWDVKTVTNEEGWFVELRIPISSLRFQNIDGATTMGMIVWRWIPHKNENVTFPAIDRKYGDFAFLKPSKAQEIVFKDIKPKKPIYITPYALGGWEQFNELNDDETRYEEESKPILKFGGDLKYGITPNLTLDLTVNTDFAQVEVDDQQVNLTRYSLFFPEKRQFFQERSSIFSYNLGGPQDIFYSRKIGLHEGKEVQIYGGARLVGRVGAWDLGFLNMQTAALYGSSELDSSQDSLLLHSENFGVLRMRRQVINENSYVGGIFTSRIGTDGSYNYVYGLDGIFRLFGDDYLDIKWSQSFETGAKNKVLSMNPTKIRLSWQRRNDKGFGYTLGISHSGADFNPGIGFEFLDNYKGSWNRLQWGWLPGMESKLQSHKVYLGFRGNMWNESGIVESATIEPGWTFQTKKFLQGDFKITYKYENVEEDFDLSDEVSIPTGQYKYLSTNISLTSPMTRPFFVNSIIDVGQFYDGSRFSMLLIPTWKVSSSLNFSIDYQYNNIKFTDRSQQFIAHIGRFKMLFMLSTAFTASAFIQYNSAINAVSSNIRLRYNPREGNDLYIVFNEGRNTQLEREVPKLPTISNRNILVKYTYTFGL